MSRKVKNEEMQEFMSLKINSNSHLIKYFSQSITFAMIFLMHLKSIAIIFSAFILLFIVYLADFKTF